MPRIARVVVEGLPHHITQRGNARQIVFDDAKDRHVYLNLLRGYAQEHRLRLLAWCLMSNHVHLLGVPETTRALARALGRTHCDYARYRNARVTSCGHLWQARYYSCPIDGPGVWRVMAYIERNPVRAGLVAAPEDYPWSSASAHVTGHDELGFLDMQAWRQQYDGARWRDALRIGTEEEAWGARLQEATRTGRPFGSSQFLEEVENRTDRRLRSVPVGRPRKVRDPEARLVDPRQHEIGV
jgi:putative transposase